MIASVLMTRGAMVDLTPQPGKPDEDALIALHAQLVRMLSRHGVLLGSTEDWRRLNAAVDVLDDDERIQWHALLARLEQTGRLYVHHEPPAVLDDMATLADVVDALPPGRHIAVLSSARAAALGIAARTASRMEKDQEIVRSRRTTDAERLRSLVALADRGVYPQDMDRETVFDQVLRPLASWSTDVLVADRYLYKELQWRSGRRGRPAEAVAWLLDRLSQHALPGAVVTLLGGVGEKGQPETTSAAARLVRAAWSPTRKRVAEVRVRGTHWPDHPVRQQLAHDRHIAFGCDLAVKFAEGLDRLREPTLWDPNGTWWTYVWTPEAIVEIRDAEERMSRAAGAAAESIVNPRLAPGNGPRPAYRPAFART